MAHYFRYCVNVSLIHCKLGQLLILKSQVLNEISLRVDDCVNGMLVVVWSCNLGAVDVRSGAVLRRGSRRHLSLSSTRTQTDTALRLPQ